MKLSLVFLLAYAAVASAYYQPRAFHQPFWFSPYQRPHQPYFYDDYAPAVLRYPYAYNEYAQEQQQNPASRASLDSSQHQQQNNEVEKDGLKFLPGQEVISWSNDELGVDSRAKYGHFRGPQQQQKPSQRLFFGSLFNGGSNGGVYNQGGNIPNTNWGSNNLGGVQQSGNNGIIRNLLFPSVTVTATVTTAVVQSCIPSSLFAAGSTAACVRKRRDIMELLELMDEGDLDEGDDAGSALVSPTAVESVKPTALNERHERDVSEVEASLDSSKVAAGDVDSEEQARRQGRMIFNLVGSVRTVTSFFFTSTIIQKPLTGVAGAGSLLCLPVGVSLCM